MFREWREKRLISKLAQYRQARDSYTDPRLNWRMRSLQEQAEKAISALGQMHSRLAVDSLIGILLDTRRGRLRCGAASALGQIGDNRAVPPLLEVMRALREDDLALRATAHTALTGMGWVPANDTERAEVEVCVNLDSFTEWRTLGAAAVPPLLTWIDAQVERLMASLARGMVEWDATGCQRVYDAIREIRDGNAVPALIAALEKKGGWERADGERQFDLFTLDGCLAGLRRAAADALGEIGDKRAVRPLVDALADEWAPVRSAAARALEKLGDIVLRTPDKARLYIAKGYPDMCACIGLGGGAVKPLIEALARPHGRPETCRGETTENLLAAHAAEVLGDMGDTRALEPLLAVFDRAYSDADCVRLEATKALGKLGGQRAVEKLRSILEHPYDHAMKEAAQDALRRLAPRV